MIRKTLFIGTGLTILALFLFGRHASSYVSTGANWVRESVKDSVPIHFELDRARTMIRNLDPAIAKAKRHVAEQEVAVEQLAAQIDQADKKLGKDRESLARLNNDVKSGKDVFHYAGRTWSAHQVKADLVSRFERVKTTDQTVGSLREIHTAREKGLTASVQKLTAMQSARRDLEAKIENLEARIRMVEVAQAASEFCFDDGELGQVKELVADLQTRIGVAEKMVSVESKYHDGIPIDEPVEHEDIVEQVAQYLGENDLKVAEVSTTKTTE